MQFNLSVKFVRGCNYYTADALSTVTEDINPVERKAWIVEPDTDEFVVAISDSKRSPGFSETPAAECAVSSDECPAAGVLPLSGEFGMSVESGALNPSAELGNCRLFG